VTCEEAKRVFWRERGVVPMKGREDAPSDELRCMARKAFEPSYGQSSPPSCSRRLSLLRPRRVLSSYVAPTGAAESRVGGGKPPVSDRARRQAERMAPAADGRTWGVRNEDSDAERADERHRPLEEGRRLALVGARLDGLARLAEDGQDVDERLGRFGEREGRLGRARVGAGRVMVEGGGSHLEGSYKVGELRMGGDTTGKGRRGRVAVEREGRQGSRRPLCGWAELVGRDAENP
jgi:hypothetical protein